MNGAGAPPRTRGAAAGAAPAAPRVRGCCIPPAAGLPTETAERLAATFRALADPTRVQMLHMLKASPQPVCVCDFTAAFDLGQPTISHHLARLRDAGLVHSVKRGLWSFHILDDAMPPDSRAALALIP